MIRHPATLPADPPDARLLARFVRDRDPAAFGALIDRIVAETVEYLSGQIDAGVDAVQLFDSWSGSLSPAQFEHWVIAPTIAIVSALANFMFMPDYPVWALVLIAFDLFVIWSLSTVRSAR